MRPAAAAVALLLLGGCGYQTGSLMPEGVTSVAVETFGNDSRYRQIEVDYTRELARELARRAHVVLRDPEDADAVIRGRITDVSRLVLVEDENDRVIEGGVVATVRVEMVDPRTGAPLLAPLEVRRRAGQIVPRPETLEGALAEVMRDLARDTVNRLQAESFLRDRAGAPR